LIGSKSASDDHHRQKEDHDLRPKADGPYLVEFRTAGGEALTISIPRTEAAVVRHFQERMPYGLFVQDVSAGRLLGLCVFKD
jgi:hypothetical protein